MPFVSLRCLRRSDTTTRSPEAEEKKHALFFLILILHSLTYVPLCDSVCLTTSTHNHFTTQLDSLIRLADLKDGVLVVYLATHGVVVASEDEGNKEGRLCIVCPDGKGIPLEDIVAKLSATRAKTAVLILDVCNSGGNLVDLYQFQKEKQNVAVLGSTERGSFQLVVALL